jgi:hypothetical protein
MNMSKLRPISLMGLMIFVCGCHAQELEVETNGFENSFTISVSTNNCWSVSYDSGTSGSLCQRNTGASIFGTTSAELIATNLLVVTSSDVGRFAVGPSDMGGLFQVDCVKFDAGTNLYWILQSDVKSGGVLYESAMVVKKENGRFLDPIEHLGMFSKWDPPQKQIDELTQEQHENRQE